MRRASSGWATVIANERCAFVQRTVGNDLFPDPKQIMEVVLIIRHQQRATSGGFKEPHVIGVGLRDISVMIDGDLGPTKRGEHIAPPDFAVQTCLFDPRGTQGIDAVSPTFERNELRERGDEWLSLLMRGREPAHKRDGV